MLIHVNDLAVDSRLGRSLMEVMFGAVELVEACWVGSTWAVSNTNLPYLARCLAIFMFLVTRKK